MMGSLTELVGSRASLSHSCFFLLFYIKKTRSVCKCHHIPAMQLFLSLRQVFMVLSLLTPYDRNIVNILTLFGHA